MAFYRVLQTLKIGPFDHVSRISLRFLHCKVVLFGGFEVLAITCSLATPQDVHNDASRHNMKRQVLIKIRHHFPGSIVLDTLRTIDRTIIKLCIVRMRAIGFRAGPINPDRLSEVGHSTAGTCPASDQTSGPVLDRLTVFGLCFEGDPSSLFSVLSGSHMTRRNVTGNCECLTLFQAWGIDEGKRNSGVEGGWKRITYSRVYEKGLCERPSIP